MGRVEPEEQDFDPETFTAQDAAAAFEAGVEQFEAGEYHAAHEDFERCWLANEAGDADFYKGLIQASICMHHFRRGNYEGARKLYSGHRRLLGGYLPAHGGIDVAGLLAEMQRVMRDVVRLGEGAASFAMETRPRMPRAAGGRGQE